MVTGKRDRISSGTGYIKSAKGNIGSTVHVYNIIVKRGKNDGAVIKILSGINVEDRVFTVYIIFSLSIRFGKYVKEEQTAVLADAVVVIMSQSHLHLICVNALNRKHRG